MSRATPIIRTPKPGASKRGASLTNITIDRDRIQHLPDKSQVVYGRPSRPQQATNISGCMHDDENMWLLLQGAFADDWIKARPIKQLGKTTDSNAARSTRASAGHAAGAAARIMKTYDFNHQNQSLFKMPRFRSVLSKVKICSKS